MKKLSDILTVSECLQIAKKGSSVSMNIDYRMLSIMELSLAYMIINPHYPNERMTDQAILMLELINERLKP